ncbi:MAG: serine hydrolase [Candidatus Omnitrophota bacterium]
MTPKKKAFRILVMLALVGCSVYLSCVLYCALQRNLTFAKRKTTWQFLQQQLEQKVKAFPGEAGIIIKDLDMGWEIAFNPEKKFPSASLAKIPIMAACYAAQSEGKLRLTDVIKLQKAYRTGGSGVLKNAPVGTELSIEELLEHMIGDSDNTATNIFITKLGYPYLNDYFKRLGLEQTNLVRKMMDFSRRKQGVENYTSARDMARILEMFYWHSGPAKDYAEPALRLLKLQRYNDRIPAKLPYYVTVLHKTGLENRVCHDVGIVYTAKGNFIISVLTGGLTQSKQAKEFISRVSLDVYNYFFDLVKPRGF